ncbi:MAG: hypothetical protein ACOC58_00275 [Chloroflexota bacterium]
MTEYQEAMKKVAQVAMADLLGGSEPPPGMADNYPFNALAWKKTLPKEWQDDAERVITHVYHTETMPEFSIIP